MIFLSNRLVLIFSFQFLERSGKLEGGRKKASKFSRIIPGDWGKVEPGWLAQPLLNESCKARDGGGKIHQFLWRCSRIASNAKEELGDEARLETTPNRVK